MQNQLGENIFCLHHQAIYQKDFLFGFTKKVQKEPPKASTQSEIFQGRGGLRKLAHFDKQFDKKLTKTAPQGKILEFFLLDTLKNNILNGEFNPEMDTIRAFFSQNQGTFYDFKKRAGEASLLPTPLVAHLKGGL